ncbi:MAG: hypothetical protein M1819_001649 [Sarea resinae]|nr:MAG: hypothetical protein M1819_001649 [Sarea resinae]
MTAAVVAASHGLKVLVLEKTKYYGGTTAYSGGGAWIPNNKHQPAIGVEDSREQAETYLHHILGDLYNAKKVESFLDSAPKMVDWLEKNSSVKFKPVPLPDYHIGTEGSNVGRTILTQEFDGRELGRLVKDLRYPLQGYSAFGSMQADPAELGMLTNPFGNLKNFSHGTARITRYLVDLVRYGKGTELANGNALAGRLLHSAIQKNVDVWNESPAIKPIVDSSRVAGLVVRKNGKDVSIGTRHGVVLASGGFGRSEEMKSYLPHEWSAQPRGNTGDGKRIGLESGGALGPVNPDNGIFAPISLRTPKSGPVRRFPHFAIDRAKPGSIIVDTSGTRFANESQPYQEFVRTMHEKKIDKAFFIADSVFLKKYGMGMALPWPYPVGRLIREGYLISAPSIPALAAKLEISPSTLEATVSACNEHARTGVDTAFHRGENLYDTFYGDAGNKPNPSLGVCAKGPFYALPLYPGNVSTIFGLQTDEHARVVDGHGEVVQGLFAVGCDQNSVMRGTYPGGGSSIGPGMTFGYRAGLKLAS